MHRPVALGAILLGIALALPAAAELRYFGYVGGAEDTTVLAQTKSYVNFAHVASDDVFDPYLAPKVIAASQRGLKVTIDLGKVFWCPGPFGYYQSLCPDWQQRWSQWKTYNDSILSADKVLALVVRDEPFVWGANMAQYDQVAAHIKTDPRVSSWVKIFLAEGVCAVALDNCGPAAGSHAFDNYQGTLPNVDWIGVFTYGVAPATDGPFLTARARMKAKFPGKKWLYVADGLWSDGHAAMFNNDMSYMGTIARQYYDLARNDPDAEILGVFSWGDVPGFQGSMNFPCSILQEHAAIGRAITGKSGRAPIGTFSIDTLGVVSGWACDPDQNLCEYNPQVKIFVDGALYATLPLPYGDGSFTNLQCGIDTAFRFKYTLPRSTAAKSVTVAGVDSDSAGAQIASGCPQSPACSWTSHLKYFGYAGTGDDAANRGLDETKGFTNFSHIATPADLSSPFVSSRVTAMAQRGLKATIDLGLVLWCGSGYRNLCSDWTTRWQIWKANNAGILTADKVLGFAILDGPFARNANMAHYEAAAAQVKTDFPWAKTFMIEAACVVKGQCGTTVYPAWINYTGTLPNIDWVGLNGYAIRPLTDPTYQTALNKLKNRYPSKQRVYVLDGYWDPNAHGTVFGSITTMRSVAKDWYDAAHNDPGAVMLGVFIWTPMPGWTTSRDFPCSVLSLHRDIGREITLKSRPRTALPIGRLEDIFDGSGVVVGYACDPDGSICEDPWIDLYADGSYHTAVTNYPSRYDFVVNPQCGVGVAYRFRHTLGQSGASGRNVTAFARDLDSGGVTLPSNCAENPACLWFSTYHQPKGYMDGISPTGVATGWVCDPDAPHLATKVRLALDDGTPIGTFTTNLGNEQAVANECGGGYLHRFSVQLPAWARYRAIYAFSQDVYSGEEQIPWPCDEGWYCIWY